MSRPTIRPNQPTRKAKKVWPSTQLLLLKSQHSYNTYDKARMWPATVAALSLRSPLWEQAGAY